MSQSCGRSTGVKDKPEQSSASSPLFANSQPSLNSILRFNRHTRFPCQIFRTSGPVPSEPRSFERSRSIVASIVAYGWSTRYQPFCTTFHGIIRCSDASHIMFEPHWIIGMICAYSIYATLSKGKNTASRHIYLSLFHTKLTDCPLQWRQICMTHINHGR